MSKKEAGEQSRAVLRPIINKIRRQNKKRPGDSKNGSAGANMGESS